MFRMSSSATRARMSFETPARRTHTVEKTWPWDFPPGSPGSVPPVRPPRQFLETLARLFPDWVVAWQPVTQRYCLWRPEGEGWKLAFYCQNPYGEEWADVPAGGAIPLDNRVFAFLHDSNPATYGGLRAMKLEIARRHETLQREQDTRRNDWLDELWHGAEQNAKIRIGYGKSPGNRFSRQVSGEAAREVNVVAY